MDDKETNRSVVKFFQYAHYIENKVSIMWPPRTMPPQNHVVTFDHPTT